MTEMMESESSGVEKSESSRVRVTELMESESSGIERSESSGVGVTELMELRSLSHLGTCGLS